MGFQSWVNFGNILKSQNSKTWKSKSRFQKVIFQNRSNFEFSEFQKLDFQKFKSWILKNLSKFDFQNWIFKNQNFGFWKITKLWFWILDFFLNSNIPNPYVETGKTGIGVLMRASHLRMWKCFGFSAKPVWLFLVKIDHPERQDIGFGGFGAFSGKRPLRLGEIRHHQSPE